MNLEKLNPEQKTALITGATRGIGLATAQQLAAQGWNIVIVGRDPARIQSALAQITTSTPHARVAAICADLANQQDVRRVALEYLETQTQLNVLVNNVGASLMKYTETVDGIETTWALNYLNHFLLTHMLLPALRTAAQSTGEARVIEIGSSMYRIASNDFARRPARKRFNGALAYAYSKRAMLLFMHAAARRWAGSGISMNTITPGFVATNVAADNPLWARWIMAAIRVFSLPVDAGARPVTWLANDPSLRGVSGQFFARFRQLSLPASVQDRSAAQQLWQYSLQATRIDDSE